MAPIALNWYDLEFNGMPAVNRALERLVVEMNLVESQQSVAIHQMEERVATVEYLLSEELLRELLRELGAQRGPVIMEMGRELGRLQEDLAEFTLRVVPAAAPPIEPRTECVFRQKPSQDGTGTAGGEDQTLSADDGRAV